jgi:hypothetical protein
MPAPLTPWQLELARHCFRYNDSSTYYLSKLSTQDIAGDIQCSTRTVQKLRKLWEKTKDVEKLRKRGGRPKSLDEYVEQAIVQVFLDFFEWVLEAFNVTGDPGSHFRHAGYTRQRPKDSQM